MLLLLRGFASGVPERGELASRKIEFETESVVVVGAGSGLLDEVEGSADGLGPLSIGERGEVGRGGGLDGDDGLGEFDGGVEGGGSSGDVVGSASRGGARFGDGAAAEEVEGREKFSVG